MEVKVKGIYRHFKGDYYLVEDIAIDSETGKKVVVYRGLYGNSPLYTRDYDNFLSFIEREKYPYADQELRFELVDVKSVR